MANSSPLDDMDNNFVALFQRGNKEDYLRLYNKYAPAVLGVLTRTIGDQKLAENCMNQAFCKIWSQRLDYDPSKERLFTWMIKIAKVNATCGPLGEQAFIADEIREEIDLVYATDMKAYLQEKKRTEGNNFAVGVDETIKEALHLIYFKSYSFAAAAEKLGISVDVLRANMVRTLKQLKGSVLA